MSYCCFVSQELCWNELLLFCITRIVLKWVTVVLYNKSCVGMSYYCFV